MISSWVRDVWPVYLFKSHFFPLIYNCFSISSNKTRLRVLTARQSKYLRSSLSWMSQYWTNVDKYLIIRQPLVGDFELINIQSCIYAICIQFSFNGKPDSIQIGFESILLCTPVITIVYFLLLQFPEFSLSSFQALFNTDSRCLTNNNNNNHNILIIPMKQKSDFRDINHQVKFRITKLKRIIEIF